MPAAAYLRLADELEEQIASLVPGARLPSEHELAGEHGVHRLTARAALDELERRYLVRRTKGAGTFVARRIEYRIAAGMAPSLTETVALAGFVAEQRNERVRKVRPPAAVRKVLGDAVVAVDRVATVDGQPAAVATSWLAADLVPDLASVLPRAGSLFRVLDEHYGLRPVRDWSRAELEVATADVARRLGLDGRPHVWSLESGNTSARHRRPLEVSHGRLRADLFHVVFELGGS